MKLFENQCYFGGKKKTPVQELTPYQFRLISKQNKGSFLLRRGRS